MKSSNASDAYFIQMDSIKMSIKCTYVIKTIFHCSYVQIIYKLHLNIKAKCVEKHLKSRALVGEGS